MLKGLSVKQFIISFLILFFGSNSLFALVSNEKNLNLIYDANLLSISQIKTIFSEMQPILTFTAGTSISQLGQFQSFAPLDLCRYTYQPENSNATNMLWGGFVGAEVKRSLSWELTAGFGYYQPNTLSTKGILTQGADPLSNNVYNYRYQIQSRQLLAESKLYWLRESVKPFIMVGLGAAFNKTSHYQTSVPPFLEFTPAFSGHTQTNFTYAIGFGSDFSLSKVFRLGIAYRFSDLGAANTGSAQIDEIPISSTLKQSHLYANQILAQFTFTPWTRN